MSPDTEQTHDDGPYSGYAEPRKRPPFGIYAALTGIFIAGHAAALGAAKRSGRGLPAQVSRAPFTEYEGRGGPAEVEERARGTGVRQAIGELLICPYKAAEDRGLGGS